MAKMYNEFRIRRTGAQSRQPVTLDCCSYCPTDEETFVVRIGFRKANKPSKWLDAHLSPDEALQLSNDLRRAAETARVANIKD